MAAQPGRSSEMTKEPARGQMTKDAWDYANRPEAFELPLTTNIDALPLSGRAAEMPWTETYWPTRDDSMNFRWQGLRELSPLEKYDLAFNGWQPPPGFFELVPLTKETCANGTWDPEYYEQLGPAAKKWSALKGNGQARNGIDDDGDGRIDECDDLDGIQDWWGSCHAWVPASLLEKEPLTAAEVNGVRFEVSDIKALLILLYDESRQIAVGHRCTLNNPPRDATGRIIDASCRNTNAGTFHLIITNMLGLMSRALGEDRVATEQVWNQPISGYRIEKQLELNLSEALTLLNLPETRSYAYNAQATRFVEVKMVVDYITESHPSHEALGNVIQDYVRTDTYHYLLELDDAGEILGGEWVPNSTAATTSSEDRPDFLWVALGAGKTPIPEVDNLAVRHLHRLSRPETRDQSIKTFRTIVNQKIPDWPAQGLRSVIMIDEDTIPEHITIGYEVLHDFIYDLSVKLVRNGQEVVLFDRQPRGSYTTIVDRVNVSAFNGENARGEWSLIATDHAGRSIGRFLDWHIELVGSGSEPPPTPPRSAREVDLISKQSNEAPMTIPDNNLDGVFSVLRFDEDGTVDSVQVTVDIEHSYVGDLRIELIHEQRSVVLHDKTGENADNLNLSLRFGDFSGMSVSGNWTLRVTDTSALDEGVLQGWALEVTRRPSPN